jgi:hypothetical protein
MKILFTCILFFCALGAFAQDFDIKKDVVSVDGIDLFKINGGGLSTTFSIENMQGKKLIFLKVDNNNKNENGTAPYLVTFLGYPNISGSFQGSIPVKKSIAKEIVENDLLTSEGELNEDNVLRYCGAANTSNRKTQLASTGNNYVPVMRNTEAPFFTAGGQIKQDFKLIGKYKTETETSNGKVQKRITISGYNNTPLATATYYTFAEEADIYFIAKAEKETIAIPNANDIQVLESIVKYLIEIGNL